MGKNDIVAGIRLEGEKEFKDGLTSVNKSLAATKSEMALVKAECAGQENSLESLTKKHEVLNKILQEQQKKVEATKAGLNHAKETYENVGKGLEDLYTELEKATDKMEDLEKIYGSSSQEALNQGKIVQQLNDAIEKGEVNYQRAGNRVKDWETKLNTAEAQVIQANKSLNQNAAYMKEAEQATDNCATSINKFGKEISDVNTNTFSANLKTMAVEKSVDVLEEVVKKAIEAGKYVVDVGSSFEAGMSEVAAISAASGEQLEKLTKKAKTLGSTTKFSATEAASAMTNMSLAGWSVEEILSGIDGVMQLAAASGMELADASQIVTDNISSFNLAASDATNIADMMAWAQANSSTTAAELGDAYGNCAANMNAAGQDIETTTSFLEALANNGLRGSEAGTSLAAVMRDMTSKMKDGSIAIGDTSVAVMDSNGNFRDMTDVLKDVEDATDGMGDAEKQAALMSTFTSDSIKGLNILLNAGADEVAGYEEQLRKCSGAASDMADVMEDNLKGDLTTAGSALEGLGIAAYEYIDGPARSVVQGVTEIITGITDAITPQKTEIEQLVTDIKIANDEIKGILDGAADTMTNAEEEAAKLEILGTQLMNLNVIEEKSAGQKLQLKSVVEQLGQQIPEIAEAYDEEAGKIELSDLQIQNLIAHTKDLMIAQAAQTALQETVNALMQAQVEYEKAQGATEAAKEKLSVYEEEKELLLNLQNEYDRYNQAMSNAQSAEEVEEIEKTFMNAEKAGQAYIDFWKVALDSGRVTLEEYEAAMENCGVEQFGNRLVKNENDISKWSKTVSDAEKETQKAGEQLENCEEDYEDYSDAVDKATEALENSTNAVAENDSATDANAARQEQLAMRQRDVAESTEEEKTGIEGLTEALAENATAADRAAEAQKNAAQSVSDAYHGYVDEIKADLQDKISLFDKFDASSGGEDQTVETMTENLNSQIEAYQEYEKNLAEVRDHVGKEIAPEFMQYLEEMGLEGSNTLKHILATFEDGDAEKIKEMSDKWVEAMDVSEGIAETQAANKLAYEMSIKEFGSTDADFSALSSSIDTAVSKAAEGWANLPKKTKTALDKVVQTAQACGIQIPEGLAAGIESGEISPEEAFGQLTGAIQGSFDGLAEIAKELGIQVPEGLQEGIDAGGQSAVDAFDQMFNAIAAGADTAALTQKGQEAGESFSSGIENSTEAAGAAATGMTDAAVAALEQAAPQFQQAGADSAANYANAFQTAISQASQSAGALASAARSAVASYQNSFYNTGYNLSAGIASGMRAGQYGVSNAAAQVVREALAAAKRAGDIHSPSRKFRNEVGAQISKGMAFGISDKASLAGKAATKMSNKVYSSATSWLSKYKKKQKVSLEEEKWYWEQVVKHTKKGTAAYNNAIKKVNQITATQNLKSSGLSSKLASDTAKEITKNFSVSKTTGSGKNKKNKDADTYYSEIYTAAQKYLSNQQILNDWSLEQELAYWEAVKKNLKQGTQGWYDATKQIKTLQADIAEAEANAAEEKIKTQASVQRDLLDKYKVYYKVSAKAEMDYWNLARQQFQTGTDERIEADQKYLEACQDYYEQRKELDEEYAENSKQINDDLADSVKELQDTYKDAVASRKQDILSSMNLFESWDATGYDGDTLLYNLKTQVAGLALWEQQLEELGKKGLSDALMEELSAMGPDAAANIYSLNQMTAEQLAEYNKLWTQKNDLANSQAIKDNAGLLAETNKEITNLRTEAQSELNALNADYRAALQELNTGISSELKKLVKKAGTIGEDAVSGLIANIKKQADSVETYNSTTQIVGTISSQLDKLKEEGKVIGANALDGLLAAMQDSTKINTASQQVIQSIKRAMEEEAEIHSPSRLFRRETGPQIPAGLALGMEDGTQQAVRSAQEMMQETLAAAHGELGKQQATLQTQVESLSYSGIARLNRLTEQTPQAAPVVNIDNSTLATLLGTLINTVNGLAEKIDSQQLVLDTGVVAAQMQPLISQESAAITVRRNRGRY